MRPRDTIPLRPEWRNWQTRGTQNPVSFGTCGFDPHLRQALGRSSRAGRRPARRPGARAACSRPGAEGGGSWGTIGSPTPLCGIVATRCSRLRAAAGGQILAPTPAAPARSRAIQGEEDRSTVRKRSALVDLRASRGRPGARGFGLRRRRRRRGGHGASVVLVHGARVRGRRRSGLHARYRLPLQGSSRIQTEQIVAAIRSSSTSANGRPATTTSRSSRATTRRRRPRSGTRASARRTRTRTPRTTPSSRSSGRSTPAAPRSRSRC